MQYYITKAIYSLNEPVFQKLNWDLKGLRIDGEYVNRLRFADDTALSQTT